MFGTALLVLATLGLGDHELYGVALSTRPSEAGELMRPRAGAGACEPFPSFQLGLGVHLRQIQWSLCVRD